VMNMRAIVIVVERFRDMMLKKLTRMTCECPTSEHDDIICQQKRPSNNRNFWRNTSDIPRPTAGRMAEILRDHCAP
jgi:hypothetical protein